MTTWLVIPTGLRHHYLPAMVDNAGIPPDRIVIVATRGLEPPLDVTVLHDDGPVNIQRWWNTGIDYAERHGATHVAVFNDDLRITPDVIPAMRAELDSSGASICYVGHGIPVPALTGWAFMLNLTHGLRPDERYRWYYGDNDLHKRAIAGRGITAITAQVDHVHPGESTQHDPELLALSAADRITFETQWGT